MRRQFVWFLLCLMPVGGLMGAKKRRLSAEMAKKVDFWEAKETEGISLRENQLKDTTAGTGETGDVVERAFPEAASVDMPPAVNIFSERLNTVDFLKADDQASSRTEGAVAVSHEQVPGALQKGLLESGELGIVYRSPKEELAAHENEFNRLLVLEHQLNQGEISDVVLPEALKVQKQLENLSEKVAILAENQPTLRAEERSRLGDLRDMVNTHLLSTKDYQPSLKIAKLSYSAQERAMYDKKVEALVKAEIKNLKSKFGTRVAESIVDQEMLAILRGVESKKTQIDLLARRLKELSILGISPQNRKQKAILAQLEKIPKAELDKKDAMISDVLQDIDKRSAPESNFIKNFIARSCGCPKGWVQFKRARAFDKQLKHLDVGYLLGAGSAEAIGQLNLMKPVTDRQIELIRTIKTFITDNQAAINPSKSSPEERVASEDRAAPPTVDLPDPKAGMRNIIDAHKKLLSFKRIFTQNKRTVLLISTALVAGALATVFTGGAFLVVAGGAYLTADKVTGGRLSTAAKDAVGNMAIVKDTRALLEDKQEVVLTPEQIKAQTLRRAALSKRIQDAKVVLDNRALVVKKDEEGNVFTVPAKQPVKVASEASREPVVGSVD